MKDAFGGILNLVLIVIFLVVVEGILGLAVNYSKAFRMKNIVISAIERYEGFGCFSDKTSGQSDCRVRIQNGAKSIGYFPNNNLNCSTGYTKSDNYFCYKKSDSSSGNHYVYTIVTQVDINIPIINKILSMDFFQVHGDTRVIDRG